jgi:hypothetical protein
MASAVNNVEGRTRMISPRMLLNLVAMSLALAACTPATTRTQSTDPAPATSWTQTSEGRVAISNPGTLGYSVMVPAGWSVSPGARSGQGPVEIAPREGGAATQLGITRLAAGEAPEAAAVRLAARLAPNPDTSRPPEQLAPIPLRSGGGRRAQVYSVPQRASERVIIVALIPDQGAWAYQILYAASRAHYDRAMPLMRNIVASYRPESL